MVASPGDPERHARRDERREQRVTVTETAATAVQNAVEGRVASHLHPTGSFAVAARQLGYTPSAVSQQIAALERAVRLPLLHGRPAASVPRRPRRS